MPRTPLFGEVARILDLASERSESRNTLSRRRLLQSAAAAALAARPLSALALSGPSAPRIAIIGGGLAGLACADTLRQKGYAAQVFDANSRLGGRCWSLRGFFPGQVAERGGELIDTPHKTMLAYANRFGLQVEDVKRKAGETSFHFMGQNWSESDVVEQFRAVASRIRADLKASSGAPTYDNHNQADIDLDNTDLASYLASRCAGYPLVQKVLDVAYNIEYGLETSEQGALNLILFMRINSRSKFQPFGVSNERYHIAGGNDLVVQGLASELVQPAEMGAALTRLRKNGLGEYEMFFNGSSTPVKADYVVLTMPFTALRDVVLEPSLGLSAEKQNAIATLGYGTNAKCMVGFDARVWNTVHGASGEAYGDLANFQSSWETNRANSGPGGVITDYSGGVRGASLTQIGLQSQVDAWLTDFDTIFPGAKATASTVSGSYLAHLEHWPSNPLTKGSYTCYRPGQFTTVAGLEGAPVGKLKFAGEHADSFYSWQGYMEGACLSGIRAAGEVLGDIKSGA